MKVDAGRTALVYALVDGRPRLRAVVTDGEEVALEAEEEIAVVVDGRRRSDADLAVSDVRADPAGAGLSWTLRGDDLSVAVAVEADRAAGVVRIRAEVTGRGRLEALSLVGWRGPVFAGFEATGEPVAYNAGPPGLGQPVFGPGFFVGIEHPVAENLVSGGGAASACTLPLAVDLGAEAYAAPAAAVGAGGLDEFWDYVDTLRPVPARLVILANNWYHLGATGRMDEASVKAELAGFAEVADGCGLALDFVCLDDGWEGEWEPATGLWGRMAPSKFPAGPAPFGLAGATPLGLARAEGRSGPGLARSEARSGPVLVRSEGRSGPGIGLWLSPFGGYGERRAQRVAWAAGHGLEVEAAAGVLCPAGDRYRAQLVRALAAWTEAGVGYWKLDGVRFVCDDPAHGHPVGPGARTAQVDRFLDLVAGIRRVRPGVVVAFTIGSHPSPWWLASVDFLWRGGLDDTAAEPRAAGGAAPVDDGSRLDRFDTYIDTCLQAYRLSAVPVSALATFSVVESAAASYRDGDIGAWERHCWLAVGRGTLHQDLYVAPDSLSLDEWEVLARALAWAAPHQAVLARTRMVLGDPGRGEVYGFAGRRPTAHPPAAGQRLTSAQPSDRAGAGGAAGGGAVATLCLRNPAGRPATVAVDWAGLLGVPAGTDVVLAGPHGGAGPAGGTVTLAPFAVQLVVVRPAAD